MSLLCPCCSQKEYEQCCQPFLSEHALPSTPEQLMRSRYTAYSQAQFKYIKKTMLGKPLLEFDEQEAQHWAKKNTWVKLDIIQTQEKSLEVGFVTFIASFIEKNKLKTIHECSEFHKKEHQWFYVDGVHHPTTNTGQSPIARAHPCPCGSGKKFKNCHEQHTL